MRSFEPETVSEAVEASIRNNPQLRRRHSAAVATLRVLARKIDAQDEYFRALLDDSQEHNGRPPAQDNVTIPTFLKNLQALGLTLDAEPKAKPAKSTEKPKPSPMAKFTGLRAVS